MIEQNNFIRLDTIAVLGNYLPRQCGIATFTTDLSNALSMETKNAKSPIAIVMDDKPEGYDYPERVKLQIRDKVQSDYFRAADFINANHVDVVILQHEYGIFGGDHGSYVLDLIKNLRMPVITTLHTILSQPNPKQRFIISEIAKYSDKLVVMSHKAEEMLESIYNIPAEKKTFIPHGIPDIPLKQPGAYNDLPDFQGHRVILSFGLLNPGKGIEYMIRAMPKILEHHPDIVYVILGETHPHVKEADGDAYRLRLHQEVRKNGVDDFVIFHNRFVGLETLVQFLQTATIYVTPYINRDQITSGTLAYALGCGAAVVSTPYIYAEELLDEGRGRFVPFNDSGALADVMIDLLDNEEKREKIRFYGYHYCRSMTWKEVARSYLNLASGIIENRKISPKPHFDDKKIKNILIELPEVNLDHLRVLTDDTGILQHADFTIPNWYHGYCTDDNARGVIVTCIYYHLFKDKSVLHLIKKYLAFLHYAYNPENNRYRNFMSFNRNWLEIQGSEDSHARAVWGLGAAVKYAPSPSIRNMAMRLFIDSLSVVENFSSPRCWAIIIVGLHQYLEIFSGDVTVRNLRTSLSERIYERFKGNATGDWPWCENSVTYANAKIPHALILAGQWIPDNGMFQAGLTALEWLLKIQTAKEGHLSIIGNDKWFVRDGESSKFDQQPIEAMGLIEACTEAYKATGDNDWLLRAERCLGWFLGRNDLNIPVYSSETGGCGDGLQPHEVNENQGAESTLAWLISLLTMYEIMGKKDIIRLEKSGDILKSG
ncbi:MAG: glycosyltransferase family 4 protein [Spirochaetales bacterium]|nr:glycosyltransferase family 4 protein [Spirochaetales bacterium]